MIQYFSSFFFYILIWTISSIVCRHVTLLHISAGYSQLECLKYLIQIGCQLESQDLIVKKKI